MQGLDAAHRARRSQRPRGERSAGRGRRARPIRATSAAPTGSICGSRLRPMRIAIRRCWWWAAGRPGSRSPRGSRSCGVDALIVDREPRIGDNWRKRYHALTLHNQVHVNHLPYMPFPPNWPTYIPKDKLAALVRGLCGEHGAQLLDRHRVPERTLRRNGAALDGEAAPARRQRADHASAARRHGDGAERHSEPGPTFRPCRTSAARSCIRASTRTARPGKASGR